MTPAQIEIARRAMALPGAPRGPGGGILWTWWLPFEQVDRIPDFSDPSGATDGALLRLLGDGWTMGRTSEGRVRLFVSKRPGKAVLTPHEAATLAEACCLCAIDLGRWPGGTG